MPSKSDHHRRSWCGCECGCGCGSRCGSSADRHCRDRSRKHVATYCVISLIAGTAKLRRCYGRGQSHAAAMAEAKATPLLWPRPKPPRCYGRCQSHPAAWPMPTPPRCYGRGQSHAAAMAEAKATPLLWPRPKLRRCYGRGLSYAAAMPWPKLRRCYARGGGGYLELPSVLPLVQPSLRHPCQTMPLA